MNFHKFHESQVMAHSDQVSQRSLIEPQFEVSAEQLEMCEVGHHSPTQLENTFSIWIDFYTEPDFKLNHISLEYLTIFCLVFENVYTWTHSFEILNILIFEVDILCEYFDICVNILILTFLLLSPWTFDLPTYSEQISQFRGPKRKTPSHKKACI